MDISAVRAGLAANAATLGGDLTTFGFVPDAIVPPAFYAGEVEIDYTGAMARGMDVLTVTCRILVGRAEDKSSQSLLDGYLDGGGSGSLKTALEADCTLGGACDDLMVLRVQGYHYYELAGSTYVGAELVVKVIGSGS